MMAALFSIVVLSAVPADPPQFMRGDVDGDLRYVLRDAIRLLDYEFADGPPPPCLDAADFDDDGRITIGDAIGLLLYLFADGPAPPVPSNTCGPDPTPDDLGCELATPCEIGSIVVRGREFRGGAFFFCLDRNGSMSWTYRGKVKMQYAKEWLIEAIGALRSDMLFGIVAYDAGMLVYSDGALKATDREKERAIAWVMNLPMGNGACLAPAGVRTVQLASQSRGKGPRIFIITDGVPACNGRFTQNECLRDITAANRDRIPIDTVFIPDDGTWEDPVFLEQLSALNDGESFQIAP